MQTFTLTMGGRLRRLFVRNTLVRTSDRIEALAATVAVLVLIILAVPVVGPWARRFTTAGSMCLSLNG